MVVQTFTRFSEEIFLWQAALGNEYMASGWALHGQSQKPWRSNLEPAARWRKAKGRLWLEQSHVAPRAANHMKVRAGEYQTIRQCAHALGSTTSPSLQGDGCLC